MGRGRNFSPNRNLYKLREPPKPRVLTPAQKDILRQRLAEISEEGLRQAAQAQTAPTGSDLLATAKRTTWNPRQDF